MKKTKKLKQNWLRLKPEIKEVWILSLPAILTQITTIVMQYIDSAMVGALGANASATIGLVASSTWLFNGVTYAVSSGFSVQVAHRIGAGEEAEARNVVRHGLVAALIVSGLLSLLGVSISGQLPAWLGGEPRIRKDATLYFFVFALMLPFSQLNSLSSSFLQCSGDMVTPSILNAVMCLLDVVFNAILIPRFGVLGAGMGTALACAVISLIMTWRCCIHNPQLRLLHAEKGHFDGEILESLPDRYTGGSSGSGDEQRYGYGYPDYRALGSHSHRGQFLCCDGGELLLYAGLWHRLCGHDPGGKKRGC